MTMLVLLLFGIGLQLPPGVHLAGIDVNSNNLRIVRQVLNGARGNPGGQSDTGNPEDPTSVGDAPVRGPASQAPDGSQSSSDASSTSTANPNTSLTFPSTTPTTTSDTSSTSITASTPDTTSKTTTSVPAPAPSVAPTASPPASSQPAPSSSTSTSTFFPTDGPTINPITAPDSSATDRPRPLDSTPNTAQHEVTKPDGSAVKPNPYGIGETEDEHQAKKRKQFIGTLAGAGVLFVLGAAITAYSWWPGKSAGRGVGDGGDATAATKTDSEENISNKKVKKTKNAKTTHKGKSPTTKGN